MPPASSKPASSTPQTPTTPGRLSANKSSNNWIGDERLLISLSFLALAGVLLFLCRSPLLRSAASLWIIDDRPARADAIVVLGGGVQNRPFAAAKLYRAGLAPKVLIFDVASSPTTKLGLTPPEHQLTRQVLIAGGVPADAIVEIGHDVASTRDEALAVRAWASTANPRSLLIPTDPFHTRRVRWLFRKTLQGTSASPIISVAPRPEYSADNWWTTEQGLIDFQNEIIKYAFYRFTE